MSVVKHALCLYLNRLFPDAGQRERGGGRDSGTKEHDDTGGGRPGQKSTIR